MDEMGSSPTPLRELAYSFSEKDSFNSQDLEQGRQASTPTFPDSIALNSLKSLQKKHLDLHYALSDALCNAPAAIASERGKTALFEAVEQSQDPKFEDLVKKFLRNPAMGVPNLPESTHAELKSMFESIAAAHKPSEEVLKVPKSNLKELQGRLAVLQSRANVAEGLVDFQPAGNKPAREKLAAVNTQIRKLNEEIRSAKQLI